MKDLPTDMFFYNSGIYDVVPWKKIIIYINDC